MSVHYVEVSECVLSKLKGDTYVSYSSFRKINI